MYANAAYAAKTLKASKVSIPIGLINAGSITKENPGNSMVNEISALPIAFTQSSLPPAAGSANEM